MKSFDGIGEDMLIGGSIGVASTVGVSYAKGINPWTGNSLNSQREGYTVYQGLDPFTDEIRYVGITKRNPEVRWKEHYNSNSPRADLRYEPIEHGLTKMQARIIEQTIINRFGMQKTGGILYNRINSISPRYWESYGIIYNH